MLSAMATARRAALTALAVDVATMRPNEPLRTRVEEDAFERALLQVRALIVQRLAE